jgi:hypothetical protein
MANKYRAVVTTVDGIRFSSKAESKRYSELKLLERAGTIYDLALQPQFKFVVEGKPLLFPNGRQAVFTADFQYREEGRGLVVEDVGSPATRTEAYALKTALFRLLFPKIVFVELGKAKSTKSKWTYRNTRLRSAA